MRLMSPKFLPGPFGETRLSVHGGQEEGTSRGLGHAHISNRSRKSRVVWWVDFHAEVTPIPMRLRGSQSLAAAFSFPG